FFFQAEDGIRDYKVTGVQTCALPISGAIPKDGPSAGTAMFTSLASLMLNKPARADIAMTGEITLRGLVLPIGGLKEKTLAALRADRKSVVVPNRNEKDLPDLPQEVRDHLK